MNILKRAARILLIGALCMSMSSCEPPQVYGSVGYSSYNGSYGGGGFGTSVRVGGRIY